MKKLYISIWFALATAFIYSAFNGLLDAASMFVYSLFALALVHGLALWSVIVNSRGLEGGWGPEVSAAM